MSKVTWCMNFQKAKAKREREERRQQEREGRRERFRVRKGSTGGWWNNAPSRRAVQYTKQNTKCVPDTGLLIVSSEPSVHFLQHGIGILNSETRCMKNTVFNLGVELIRGNPEWLSKLLSFKYKMLKKKTLFLPLKNKSVAFFRIFKSRLFFLCQTLSQWLMPPAVWTDC